MSVNNYDYELPPERIALHPAEPRDAAQLLICDTATGRITTDVFANLAQYLPTGALLVLNDTKVVPARLALEKPGGGAVRVLFLVNEWDRGKLIRGLPDRRIRIGDVLSVKGEPLLRAVSHAAEEFTFELMVSAEVFEKAISQWGKTPLPPYIKSDLDEAALRATYQTVFAEKPASVAAPTASLHFTPGVFRALEARGVKTARLTLHVGRGTFSPVTDETLEKGRLHAEPVTVSAAVSERIASAKVSDRPVIAAGTTVARALESAASAIRARQAYRGETELMIAPPFDFRMVDALITNFHLPRTSLLMLIDAFLQHKKAPFTWRELYERAMREQFRFYSFGDAMLVI